MEQYNTVEELTHKLSRQITIIMREINVTSVVDTRAVKRAIEEAEEVDSTNARASESVFLEDYTDRAFIAVGNTLTWKDQLKDIGGTWIKTKRGFSAWCFSKKKIQKVADTLGIAAELRTPPTAE